MYGPPIDGERCKILTHLDLLSIPQSEETMSKYLRGITSIPQSEETMSKYLRGITGCKDKTSCSTAAVAVRGVHDIWVLPNGMQYGTAEAGCVRSILL